jgi:hypothetical protein
MGGSSRGSRESYAARRPGAAEAVQKDRERQRKLGDYEEPKVFLSYHYKGDVQKVNLIRNQAERSGTLHFEETSSTERYPDNWKQYALNDIKRADVATVMVGEDTYKSKAVEWEIKKAHEHGVPVMAIKMKEDVKIPRAIEKSQDTITRWDLNRIQEELDRQKEDNNDEKG